MLTTLTRSVASPSARLAQAVAGDARLVAPGATAASTAPFTIALSPVVTAGLAAPVYLAHAGDGSGRLFVVEQAGKIRVIRNGVLRSAPFLSITNLVLCCGEQGLLGVAFDPGYEANGAFYVNYTSRAGNGDTVVARYQVSDPSSDVANPVAITHLLTIDQPQSNHNGGPLQFGPNDNYLYIGMGDGGGAGDDDAGHDPLVGNGQYLGTLLGKMLRIDVRGVPTYTIPAANPFTRTAGARPEIWAYGLRNPWRFSFDRVTGDMYIADVGQNAWEEVSYQPASSVGGENYGWRIMEGAHCFNPSNCSSAGLILPVTEYSHSLGCSVIGGYAYRGSDYPWLRGVYFYADYCSGRIWGLEQVSPGRWLSAEKLDTPHSISSFGEDENGELYVLEHANGRVYKLASSVPPDLSASRKMASNLTPATGAWVTYVIVVSNSGGAFTHTVRLTDALPPGLSYVSGSLTATLGAPDASSASTLKWSGVMSSTSVASVTYAVTISAATTPLISNTVTINPGFEAPFTRSVTIIVLGRRVYLPLLLKP